MVNNNKILTVSYGTFSCTLEGFDDSFGTMKAIAEYFRDLASDDRYFGAEPPSPDAEMLARIAEREISRRVEAHREDNTFVLRADAGTALPATAAAVQNPAQSPTEALTEALTETPPETTAKAAPEVQELPKTTAPTEPTPAPAKPETTVTETAEAEAEDNTADLADLSALVAESIADTTDALETEDAAADRQKTEPEQKVAEESEAEPVAQVEKPADPESVAAKLQRIRDVVNKSEGESAYSEDEHADSILLKDDEDDKDDISALLGKIASDQDDDENDAEDITAELIAQTDTKEAAQQPEETDLQDEDKKPEPKARARVIKMKKVDFEAAIAEGVLEEDAPETPARPNSSLSDDQEAELLKELAAVEAELSGAFEEDDHFEDGFDDEDDTLSSALEDALDDSYDEIEDDDAGENLFEEAQTAVAPKRRAHLENDTETEMGRILNETNSHLEEETGRGRRNAIAHLRAAVAATQAERGAGGDLGADGRDTEAYRDDLETVVRPRRPAGKAQTARPTAPLKLVAEQRIDTPKPAEPVQPRRVRVAPAAAPELTPAGEFSDFLDDVGAYNLGEVLEAAASYMAFVEGKEAFSRPQLMSKLNATEHADTSREDRLRSFGQLLREGKIRKLGGGRFEAADHISYRPEKRAADG